MIWIWFMATLVDPCNGVMRMKYTHILYISWQMHSHFLLKFLTLGLAHIQFTQHCLTTVDLWGLARHLWDRTVQHPGPCSLLRKKPEKHPSEAGTMHCNCNNGIIMICQHNRHKRMIFKGVTEYNTCTVTLSSLDKNSYPTHLNTFWHITTVYRCTYTNVTWYVYSVNTRTDFYILQQKMQQYGE